jgi:opacity protein-like surface antigen
LGKTQARASRHFAASCEQKDKTMKKLIAAIAIITAVSVVYQANAGILGQRYVGANVGYVSPGDSFIEEIDDSILTYGVELRLPVSANLDIVAAGGQRLLEGDVPYSFSDYSDYSDYAYYYESGSIEVEVTSTTVGGLLQYQFYPGAPINPFIGAGVMWSEYEIEVEGVSVDDDDTGVLVGGGLEFNLNDTMSLIGGLHYQTEMFEEDDVIANAGFNIWIIPNLLLSVTGEYRFEAEDIGVAAGLGIAF